MANCCHCLTHTINPCHSVDIELHGTRRIHTQQYYSSIDKLANIDMSRVYRLLIPTIPFLVFLFLFYQLGSFLPVEKNVFQLIPTRTFVEECVLRIGAVGATLMAVLSGFGSICAGWETYLSPHRFQILLALLT